MIVEFGACRIELVQGDITRQQADVIVNAANSELAGGGGVDGAIHRAAGPKIMDETRKNYPEGCPTGHAVATGAGSLAAQHIFHAVGPIWQGGHKDEPALLAAAYVKCLELAIKKNCDSVAFPAISTGVYGYPIDLAAETSLTATREFLREQGKPGLVKFILFDAGSYAAFARVLEDVLA